VWQPENIKCAVAQKSLCSLFWMKYVGFSVRLSQRSLCLCVSFCYRMLSGKTQTGVEKIKNIIQCRDTVSPRNSTLLLRTAGFRTENVSCSLSETSVCLSVFVCTENVGPTHRTQSKKTHCIVAKCFVLHYLFGQLRYRQVIPYRLACLSTQA
jgi:hypothetical protein